MKSIIKLISSTVIFACVSVQAEPVMNLITINTNDPAGYAAWAKSSAPTLIKANNAMAMGLCSPTSAATVGFMGSLDQTVTCESKKVHR